MFACILLSQGIHWFNQWGKREGPRVDTQCILCWALLILLTLVCLPCNSYCGITFSCVIAELLVLFSKSMSPIWIFQHIFRKESLVLIQYPSSFNQVQLSGWKPFFCAYDTEKAFDSVEYSVLLPHFFQWTLMESHGDWQNPGITPTQDLASPFPSFHLLQYRDSIPVRVN